MAGYLLVMNAQNRRRRGVRIITKHPDKYEARPEGQQVSAMYFL